MAGSSQYGCFFHSDERHPNCLKLKHHEFYHFMELVSKASKFGAMVTVRVCKPPAGVQRATSGAPVSMVILWCIPFDCLGIGRLMWFRWADPSLRVKVKTKLAPDASRVGWMPGLDA